MMSVQNRCETSRFLTLRTMWLMPRGGWAWLRVGEASLAMVPSIDCRTPVDGPSPGNGTGILRHLAPSCTQPRRASSRGVIFAQCSGELELAAQRTGGRAEEGRRAIAAVGDRLQRDRARRAARAATLQAPEPLSPARHGVTAATALDDLVDVDDVSGAHHGPSFLGVRRIDEPLSARRQSGTRSARRVAG